MNGAVAAHPTSPGLPVSSWPSSLCSCAAPPLSAPRFPCPPSRPQARWVARTLARWHNIITCEYKILVMLHMVDSCSTPRGHAAHRACAGGGMCAPGGKRRSVQHHVAQYGARVRWRRHLLLLPRHDRGTAALSIAMRPSGSTVPWYQILLLPLFHSHSWDHSPW